MRIQRIMAISFAVSTFVNLVFAQQSPNCFLQDYYPKYIAAPRNRDASKTTAASTVTVTIKGQDTLGKVSNYVFGNAAAVWVSTDINNPALVKNLRVLSPTLIRFPGGSWSDIYFWNGNPGDLPDSAYAQNSQGNVVKDRFYPQIGSWYSLTVDRYYDLCSQLGCQGLITVNYGYARYGTSANPVAQAAHYAADWVRYDKGRTQFWELGNENAGPWEAGWRIDRTKNKDGQPDTITGELYGKHFKIFADSMRAAASEIGATIYIGGQILHFDGTNDWNVANRKWNEGFFNAAGDSPDFYVMHNYFGNNATTLEPQVRAARQAVIDNISFIRQDIARKQAPVKPVALTEWNCGGPDVATTSIGNGMQAVVVIGEMLNNNFGMSARWLLAHWENGGMFYYGNNSSIPRWTPRPDFYYITFLQRFTGDHVIATSVGSSNQILAYATRFTSGHTSVVIVNKGSTEEVVKLDPVSIGVGQKFYVYSLTGSDGNQWPQGVSVNGYEPTSVPWGPLDSLASIPAWAYPIENEIRFTVPARSVEYVLIDNGNRIISSVEGNRSEIVQEFKLQQNFPNPFNPTTAISYQLSAVSYVTLQVYDVLGREVNTLVHEVQSAGGQTVHWNASAFPSGIYYYRLHAVPIAGQRSPFVESRKMVLIK